jgi:hypothetical protein
VTGKLVSISPDSLVLVTDDDKSGERSFTAATVGRLDVSRGSRSKAGRGAFIGLLAGLAGGFLALGEICKEDCVGAVVLAALPFAGALVGAGIGAGVGSLIRTERWQRVSWP